jgi:pimeloyl-ACP methyl ester carboxylesterase
VTAEAAADRRTVRTPDGRELEVLVEGAPGAVPLVWQHGTPGAAEPYRPRAETAAGLGLTLITYSRPGYGTSTPRPGRTVADAADDVSTVVDAVAGRGSRFVTIGWSGGGPHALACAALLPGRCAAAATLAGVEPHGAADLDWLAGMGEENHAEFGAASAGAETLTEWLAANGAPMASVTPEQVADSLGDLVSEVDRDAVTGELADWLARLFRRALSAGTEGWRDDDLAFVRDWGFDVAAIDVPVSVWQGHQDLMVPPSHGRWLADRLPTARDHVHPDEGHLSLAVGAMDRIVADLAGSAG